MNSGKKLEGGKWKYERISDNKQYPSIFGKRVLIMGYEASIAIYRG